MPCFFSIPPIFLSLFHPDQIDSLFLFSLAHFSVLTHWRDVPMGGEASRRNAPAPLLFLFFLGAQRKRICKHSCLSNRCLHAHTHTHRRAHARSHSGHQANNEPCFSDVEPIRSGWPSAKGGVVLRRCGHFLTPAAAHKHFLILAPVVSSSRSLSSFCPASSHHQSLWSLYCPLFFW